MLLSKSHALKRELASLMKTIMSQGPPNDTWFDNTQGVLSEWSRWYHVSNSTPAVGMLCSFHQGWQDITGSIVCSFISHNCGQYSQDSWSWADPFAATGSKGAEGGDSHYKAFYYQSEHKTSPPWSPCLCFWLSTLRRSATTAVLPERNWW